MFLFSNIWTLWRRHRSRPQRLDCQCPCSTHGELCPLLIGSQTRDSLELKRSVGLRRRRSFIVQCAINRIILPIANNTSHSPSNPTTSPASSPKHQKHTFTMHMEIRRPRRSTRRRSRALLSGSGTMASTISPNQTSSTRYITQHRKATRRRRSDCYGYCRTPTAASSSHTILLSNLQAR